MPAPYFPLWRLREGLEPERLAPWLWIENIISEMRFWNCAQDAPWESEKTKLKMESYLESNGIRTLPILAEALPLMIQGTVRPDFSQAANRLKQFYEARKNPPKAL